MDYAPIMARGFGVQDEPSILDQCENGYAGFRIFEHAARPVAILRVEKTDGLARITKRLFDNGRSGKATESGLPASAWTEFLGLVEQSGFWTYQHGDVWSPDSRTMWVEACLNGQFRSILLYPDREDLLVDVIDFLLARAP